MTALPHRLRVACLLIVLVTTSLLTFAAAAPASRTQLSVIQDDRLLIQGDDATRSAALDEMASLGADVVHVVVPWRSLAPNPNSHRRPSGFDATDPAAYPAGNWAPFDTIVTGAVARGMRVMLAPAAPIPAWASGCSGSSKVRRTCRPNPTHFRRFVEALGRRYDGVALPRVDLWTVWNEPNQGSWLSPQFQRRNGRTVATSPAIYRALVRAAAKGLQSSGHGNDEILFGETAPLGRQTGALRIRPMSPAQFLRGVLCLDRSALDCDGPFPRLPVTGIGHHPYSRGGSRSPTSRGSSSEITLASSSRLKSLLDRAAKRGRLKRKLPIWYTEYGFQTNPPDTIFGVSLDEQADWINQADWLAWKDPRVKSVAQYELRDEPNLAGFQTGLRFLDGRPKPSLDAYRLPIWVTRMSHSRVRVWGQVRATPAGGTQVEVQSDPENDGTFATVSTPMTTNDEGYFQVTLPSGGAKTWRLRWAPAGRSAVVSRIAQVSRR